MDTIPTKEMVRCQVTGKIVPVAECEYVVIKILKHKDADLNNFNLFNAATATETPKLFTQSRTAPLKDIVVPDDAVLLTKEEMLPAPKPQFPAHILALMKEPGMQGADEMVRRA